MENKNNNESYVPTKEQIEEWDKLAEEGEKEYLAKLEEEALSKIENESVDDIIPPWEQEAVEEPQEHLGKQENKKESSDFSDFSDFNKRHKQKLFDMFNLENKWCYSPAIKAVSYSIMGLPLIGKNFMIGDDELDTRLSYIIAIRSGNGKKKFVKSILELTKSLRLEYSKIVSLHEEQLIGKREVIYRGKGENKERCVEEMRGYFRDDVIIGDDVLPLLNSSQFMLSRNYFLQAWDEYPNNNVTKKNINLKKEEGLNYPTKVVSYFFVQDKPIGIDNIDTGLLRKSPILYIIAPKINKKTYLNRVLNKSLCDYGYLIKIAKIIKNTTSIKWEFSEECHSIIAELSDKLNNQIQQQGVKGKNYSSIMQWPIQNYIYKYTVILATYYFGSKQKEADSSWNTWDIKITPEVCYEAFVDLEEVIMASFKHWKELVISASTILTKWEREIVNELYENKAFSKDTAMMDNPSFIGALATKNGKGYVTFSNALKSLKEKGIVDTDIIGKAEKGEPNSKMWLKEI
ncbi:MAG: hypothetical protein ABIJ18_02815 [archaeon]